MNYLELTRAIWNSLLICCGCVAVTVPLGTVLAVLLMRTDVYGRRALAVALGSQLAVPLYVFAGSWNAGVGSQGWWPLTQVFAVKFEAISVAMAQQKVEHALDTGADYLISTDVSCLMHLEAYIAREKLPLKCLHIADVLASGW